MLWLEMMDRVGTLTSLTQTVVHSTYDILWREAMMELLDQLEAENPEEDSLAPQVRQ